MKFITGSDFHWREQSPVYRKDNFAAAQEKKIRKMFELAREYGVHRIIQNGDLFHHHQESYAFAHKMIVLLKEEMAKSPHMPPMIVNQGNHDVLGGRLLTTYEGILGMMADAGVIQLLNTQEEFCDIDLDGFQFRFIPYRLQFKMETYDTDRVIFNHEMVTTHPCIYDHVLCDRIAEVTKSNLIICSHWHSQFIKRIKATLFVNSGPMMRQSISERKIDPSVVLIELPPYEAIVRNYPAPRATLLPLGGEADVFRVPEKTDAARETEQGNVERLFEIAEEFKKSLETAVATESVDLVLRGLAAEMKTTEAALSYALETLQKARHVEVVK